MFDYISLHITDMADNVNVNKQFKQISTIQIKCQFCTWKWVLLLMQRHSDSVYYVEPKAMLPPTWPRWAPLSFASKLARWSQ